MMTCCDHPHWSAWGAWRPCRWTNHEVTHEWRFRNCLNPQCTLVDCQDRPARKPRMAIWDWLLRTPFSHTMSIQDVVVLGMVQGLAVGLVIAVLLLCLRLAR